MINMEVLSMSKKAKKTSTKTKAKEFTKQLLHVGLDVGSTTVKIVVMDNKLNIIYEDYQRHFSDTKNTVCKVRDDS